ncbi:hypothetical protein OIU14_08160 [Thalassobacter stenotrophicus]|uniref:hypothetical protein n=1 Tax=Thalassobacter TaxID=266808 RepID=UPI00051D0018|nr:MULTISPECIES: hypothetical protein [Thalassobacter]KGL02745.1 hypothetical protein PM04_01805 [Thalassobacter sp. 16PALIMAR09]UYP69676.1 hypothetical protein OIU14_08160 [Thalassobacter stenotrophicus]
MTSQIRDDIGFYAWVSLADAGAAISYHRGFLAVDTASLMSRLTPRQQTSLRSVAEAAQRASDQNLVHLVQERLGPNLFEYRAIARPKPPSPSISERLISAH